MKISIPTITAHLALLLVLVTPGWAGFSQRPSPLCLDDVDPEAVKCLMAHDAGRVRFTTSNWGEGANPDGVPGYKGFEFPINTGSDFLFSMGIWVGAQVNGQYWVSTGTDGDNGTNEFWPVHIGAAPSANATPNFNDWRLQSNAFAAHNGKSYVRGSYGVDDDGDWTPADDLDGNLHPSRNHDGGSGILGFDDDLDNLIDEETTNGVDDDNDGLIDEDCLDGDANGDGDAGYDPEPHVDEDLPGDNTHPLIDPAYVIGPYDDDGDGMIDEDAAARAPQEFFCAYQDSISPMYVGSPDPGDPHDPLNVVVTQHSYVWSHVLSRDIVLVEYTVRNAGQLTLGDVRLACFADADVCRSGEGGDACSLDDSTYYDSARRMMVTTDSNTDADGPDPGMIAVKVVKPPIPWVGAQFTYANFERVSGGDPEIDSDKYNLMASGQISSPSNAYGDWRMLMAWGSADGALSLEPGEALNFTVALIGARTVDELNSTADRLPVFDTGPNIGDMLMYTSPQSLGPYVISSSYSDNDGVNFAGGVHVNWMWLDHETQWSSAPAYSWVWDDPETSSGDYYFLIPATHANGDPVAQGDTIVFFCDGEDAFGNYTAHTNYTLIAGVTLLGVDEWTVFPGGFRLEQNYPNPFNAFTSIGYHVPQAAHVRIEIFNIAGQQVATLLNATVSAGSHSVLWDAGGLPSGLYICRLNATDHVLTRKLLLLK